MVDLLGKFSLGLIVGLGGLGTCLGISAAGRAAAGAWAAEGKEGKPLSSRYVMIVAMPISQTLYSMIIMLTMFNYVGAAENSLVLFGLAVGCGLIELFSAYGQGLIGAAGIRCLNETGGKGFGNIVIALGLIESVGLFAMVLGLLVLWNPAITKVVEVAAEVVK